MRDLIVTSSIDALDAAIWENMSKTVPTFEMNLKQNCFDSVKKQNARP